MGVPPTPPIEVFKPPTPPPVYIPNMPAFRITPADYYQRTLNWPTYVWPINWDCGDEQSLCFSDVKHVLPSWFPQPPGWVSAIEPWWNCAPICGATCKVGYVPIGPVCNRGGKSNLIEFLGDAIEYAHAIQQKIQDKAVKLVAKSAQMVAAGDFKLPVTFTLDETQFVNQLNLNGLKSKLLATVQEFFTGIKNIIVNSNRHRRRLSAKVNERVDWSKFITLDIEFEANNGYSGSGGIGFVFNTGNGDVKAYAFMCAGVQASKGFGVALNIGFWDDEKNIKGSSIEFDLSWEVKGVKGTNVGIELGIWCGQPNPFHPTTITQTISNIAKYKHEFILADMWAWGFSIGVGAGDDGPINMGAHLCVTSSPSH